MSNPGHPTQITPTHPPCFTTAAWPSNGGKAAAAMPALFAPFRDLCSISRWSNKLLSSGSMASISRALIIRMPTAMTKKLQPIMIALSPPNLQNGKIAHISNLLIISIRILRHIAWPRMPFLFPLIYTGLKFDLSLMATLWPGSLQMAFVDQDSKLFTTRDTSLSLSMWIASRAKIIGRSP